MTKFGLIDYWAQASERVECAYYICIRWRYIDIYFARLTGQ
jgi:hypothetical protein